MSEDERYQYMLKVLNESTALTPKSEEQQVKAQARGNADTKNPLLSPDQIDDMVARLALKIATVTGLNEEFVVETFARRGMSSLTVSDYVRQQKAANARNQGR